MKHRISCPNHMLHNYVEKLCGALLQNQSNSLRNPQKNPNKIVQWIKIREQLHGKRNARIFVRTYGQFDGLEEIRTPDLRHVKATS
jgi:hypothetical protein